MMTRPPVLALTLALALSLAACGAEKSAPKDGAGGRPVDSSTSPTSRSTMGQEVGNGGNAIVCTILDASGEKRQQATVLDLYEAKELFDLELSKSAPAQAPIQIARQAVQRLLAVEPEYASLVIAELTETERKLRLLSPGVGLTPIADSFHVTYPKNCEIRQLANYGREGVLVDSDIWAQLDPFNRAALLAHEAVYKVERDLYGAAHSIVARKIVAYLFSTATITEELWDAEIRPSAKLQFTVDRDDFGIVEDDVSRTYTLVNVGKAVSTPVGVIMDGDEPDMWEIDLSRDRCTGETLSPGQRCTVEVTFFGGTFGSGRPKGFYTGTLEASALNGGRASVELEATKLRTWVKPIGGRL